MSGVPPVLVVEDEPLVRLCIVEALEEGGYTVVQAENGSDAIAELERCQELRALVTDIRLGAGPTGWEVAHEARLRFATLPILYLTGDSIVQWPAEGVPESKVLQKPFASAELLQAVATLVLAQQSLPPSS
jgi:CheY-like chemotaxis protein